MIQYESVNFGIDQNVIHCKINKDFDYTSLERNISNIMPDATKSLSNGKYLPLLINLKVIQSLCKAAHRTVVSNNIYNDIDVAISSSKSIFKVFNVTN